MVAGGCLDDGGVGGEEPPGAWPADGRVLVRDLVSGGQQAGGNVEPPVGSRLADSQPVFGGDARDGVGSVVNGGEDGWDVAAGRGEGGGVADEAQPGAGWCPVRVAAGQAPGPQGQFTDFGGDRCEAAGRVPPGGDDVPLAGHLVPRWPHRRS